MAEITILDRERRLRTWFTRGGGPVQRVVDGLYIGWGGVQRWATARMPAVEGWHLSDKKGLTAASTSPFHR
jgi:hypothetical protein